MKKILMFILTVLIFSCSTLYVKKSYISTESLKKINAVVVVHSVYLYEVDGVIKDFRGRGTGFFIDEKHILTNNHVIKDSVLTTIKTFNHKNVFATVVYSNEKYDMAVLEVEEDLNIKPLEIALNSKAGDQILIIGNPAPVIFTNTAGIISKIGTIDNVMQIYTDTLIFAGSSGSPMLNMDGKVIGIVYAGYPGSRIGLGIHSKHILEVIRIWKAIEEKSK